ncbi:hypothetical protein D3C73_18710 [compost metagenome]
MDMSDVKVDDIEVTHMKRYHFPDDIHPTGATPWDTSKPEYEEQLKALRLRLNAIPNVHLAVVWHRAVDIFLHDNDRGTWAETDQAVREVLEAY